MKRERVQRDRAQKKELGEKEREVRERVFRGIESSEKERVQRKGVS